MGFELGQRLIGRKHDTGDELTCAVIERADVAHLSKDEPLEDLHDLGIVSLP